MRHHLHFHFSNSEKVCVFNDATNTIAFEGEGQEFEVQKEFDCGPTVQTLAGAKLFWGNVFKRLFASSMGNISVVDVPKYILFTCHGAKNLVDYGLETDMLSAKHGFSGDTHLDIRCSIRGALKGGKGGFGSLLKQQGRKAGKKVSDFGACRDLNGRRLRHVNDEIRLRKFRQFHNQARQEVEQAGAGSGKGSKKMERQIKKIALRNFEQFEKDAASGIGGWHTAVPKWGYHFGNSFSGLNSTKKKKETGSGKQLEDQGSNNKKRSARAAAIESYASEANSEGDAVLNAVMAGILRRRKKKKAKKSKEQTDAVHKSTTTTTKTNVATELRSESIAGKEETSNALVLTCLRGRVGLGDTGEVQGLSNYGSAGVAWVTLSKGQWYYEVELLSDGVMQIGWCDTLFIGDDNEGDGVGDDLHSWGFDGKRHAFWHGKAFSFQNKDAKLTPWKNGDVIGCYVDLDEHIMSFFVNGVDVGKVPGLDSKGDMQFKDGLYPALSLEEGNLVRVNVGQRPFAYDVKKLTGIVHKIKTDSVKSVWDSRNCE